MQNTPTEDANGAQPELNPAFLTLLQQHRSGQVLNDVAQALAAVSEAVQLAGKAGSLTLTITLKPSGALNAIVIGDKLKVTLPVLKKPESLFWVDDNGQLVRENPNQRQLPLRTIQGGAVDATTLKKVQGV